MEVHMKNLVLGFTFLCAALFSTVNHACSPQRAQFIGTVTNLTTTQISQTVTECFYEVEISMFNSSYSCPLDIAEVSSARFQDQDCALKNGDQVSGVMAKINNLIVLE
jgi:hypothetical protein